MATPSLRLLFQLSILIGILSISATARPGPQFYPCNTLVFFSSSENPNPNPNLLSGDISSVPIFTRRSSITLFFTRSRIIDPNFDFPNQPQVIVDRASVNEEEKPFLGLGFDFFPQVSDSFRDRAKDILSVVGSLLLGVGCGALTASTLYLIWSLFTPNRFEFYDSDDDSDDEDLSLKKMGYVKVPEAAVPAKEVA